MKKIISIFIITILISTVIFTVRSFAVELNTIDIQTTKTTVKPGEEVTVNINFGTSLGAYTFNIAYDDAIFEYVSVEGGTATDTLDKVKVLYYDATGGTNPRNNMSVTFRAKSNITTSNPTEFSITAEGLANGDASVEYDDIGVPIVKNVIVEPEYSNYSIKLDYTGDVEAGKEKEMKISVTSSMGRHYEHARLIASAITPDEATVQLIGKDELGMEHDIIQSGWGNAQGYKIGGKDYAQVLNVNGTFTKKGEYSITLKLIDRDDSDNVIANETFEITVGEETTQTPPVSNTTNQITGNNTVGNTNTTNTNSSNNIVNTNNTTNSNNISNTNNTTTPTELPKTGINWNIPIIFSLCCLAGYYLYQNKKN